MTLTAFLQTLGDLSEEEISFASDLFFPGKIKKGDYFLREGQLPNKISFIEKGLFRLFYKLEHEEKIMLFFSEAQFMTDIIKSLHGNGIKRLKFGTTKSQCTI
jgi:hypothetical protein